jgi:hypothetical protein
VNGEPETKWQRLAKFGCYHPEMDVLPGIFHNIQKIMSDRILASERCQSKGKTCVNKTV